MRDFKTRFESLEGRRLLTQFVPALLHDFTPGQESSAFADCNASENGLFFRVNSDEVWRTDGTPDGIFQLGEASGQPVETVDATYVLIGNELFHADGTIAGSYSIDLPPIADRT